MTESRRDDPDVAGSTNLFDSSPFLGVLDRRGFIALGASAAAGAVLAGCGGGAGHTATGAVPPTGGKPVRGGTLRVALVGGGQSETLNPTVSSLADIDLVRANALFDSLVTGVDQAGKVHLLLAESMEPNTDGSVWTIRLRPGIEWHDGSPFGADDVIYWLRWLANPKTGSINAFIPALFFDVSRVSKLDKLTVRLPMTMPIANLPPLFSSGAFGVIKNGTTSFSHPIGTGPFKFESWTPGQRSMFVRNPNYWRAGLPYLAGLELISIPDNTARLNALLAGQADAVSGVSYANAHSYMSQGKNSPINILVIDGSQDIYFAMNLVNKPFQDNRVREAFRLMVNRPALLSEANSGFGRVLNDLWGKGFPHYDNALPQRTQDVERARSLLRSAGYSNLSIQLTTSTQQIGQVEAATVFAQQASAAGVTVNLHKVPPSTYYSTGWPYPFGQTNIQGIALEYFYGAEFLPGAPYNDTSLKSASVVALVRDALADLNPSTAQDKWNALQEYFWKEGPQIHWGSGPFVDGLSKRVRGATPVPSTSFDFGNGDFTHYWLA